MMKLAVLALDYDGTIASSDALDPSVRAAIASARTNSDESEPQAGPATATPRAA